MADAARTFRVPLVREIDPSQYPDTLLCDYQSVEVDADIYRRYRLRRKINALIHKIRHSMIEARIERMKGGLNG